MPIRPTTSASPTRPSRRKRSVLPWAYFLLLLAAASATLALWKSGLWLVRSDPFEKVEWAAVMAGESRDMERTEEAASLLLGERVDSLILSGNRVFRNRYTSEFAGKALSDMGVAPERVFEYRHDAYSTIEEAKGLIRQFRALGLDTVLVVTSNYHTRRTRFVFERLAGGDPVVLVHAAPYPLFEPEVWWSSRESRKTWLIEWLKFLNGGVELAGEAPLEGDSDRNELVPVSQPAISKPLSAKPAPSSTGLPPALADSSASADSLFRLGEIGENIGE